MATAPEIAAGITDRSSLSSLSPDSAILYRLYARFIPARPQRLPSSAHLRKRRHPARRTSRKDRRPRCLLDQSQVRCSSSAICARNLSRSRARTSSPATRLACASRSAANTASPTPPASSAKTLDAWGAFYLELRQSLRVAATELSNDSILWLRIPAHRPNPRPAHSPRLATGHRTHSPGCLGSRPRRLAPPRVSTLRVEVSTNLA